VLPVGDLGRGSCGALVMRCWLPRRLRKLSPDEALFRRRAAGETLRELASDYGVSHTSLSRYFKRPEAVRELKRAEQLLRLEQRAEEARFRAELRMQAARQRDELRRAEDRWRAKEQAGPEARRRAREEKAAAKGAAAGQAPAVARSEPASASEGVGSSAEAAEREAPTPTTSGSTRPRT
jgi:hypothetical protein